MLKRRSARRESVSLNSRVHSERPPYQLQPLQRWPIWLVSIGIFLPYTFGETDKYVIALLFVPAVLVFITALSQGKRQVMACDIFVWAAALWMLAVKIGGAESQSNTLFSVGSDALALAGSYMVARSFIYSQAPVKEFVKALKFVAIVVIALSVLDTLSGTYFIADWVKTIFSDPRPIRPGTAEDYREIFGFLLRRAESTFEHPILYGTFCAVAAAIFIFTQRAFGGRIVYCGACLIGCLLSVSSAAMLGFAIVVSVYSYDRCLRSYPQRWKVIQVIVIATICALYVFSGDPISWPIRHLTLDPQSGYYRLLIWQNAFNYIALSPLTGGDVGGWSTNDILGNSIDCIWLVLSLSYGLPMVGLLLLANLSACGAFGRKINRRLINGGILQTRTGFSLVLFLFTFLGLTVDFWGAIWMLWGLCIGIRASLEEYCLVSSFSIGSAPILRPTIAEVY